MEQKTQLKRKIEETGVTVTSLAKRFGVNYNHLSQCVAGKRKLSSLREEQIMSFLRSIPK